MGCDIHPFVQVLEDDGVWRDYPAPERLYDRTYGRFAFLTGGSVRNYSEVPELHPPDRGWPKGVKQDPDDEYWGYHSPNYWTLEELLAVDYDQKFENRREYEESTVTLREFLGPTFFDIIEELKKMGAPDKVRILFDFDN